MRATRIVLTTGAVIGLCCGGLAIAGAATTSPTVKACVDTKGQLVLASKGACPKHTKKVTIDATGPTGATGPAGPSGAPGSPGAPGPSGAPATVDTSQYYTKAQSDARYVPSSSVGSTSVLGPDFHLTNTTAGQQYRVIGSGLFEAGTASDAIAQVTAVPSGATITSVDFYVSRTASQTDGDLFDLFSVDPTTDTETTEATGQLSPAYAQMGITTVTLTPSSPYTTGATAAPLLEWAPGGAAESDELLGAVVHYTVGQPG
jgi:hypothetical protein